MIIFNVSLINWCIFFIFNIQLKKKKRKFISVSNGKVDASSMEIHPTFSISTLLFLCHHNNYRNKEHNDEGIHFNKKINPIDEKWLKVRVKRIALCR